MLLFPCLSCFFCHADESSFKETLHPSWCQSFTIDEILYEEKTKHQDLLLFRNQQWGTVLALDGIIQTTEKDEFIYHESLVHIPMLSHGNAKSVLVIGGGDGGLLREILKYPLVEKITLVELDEKVIAFSKKHLPFLSLGAFDDPRIEVVIDDGASYVKNCHKMFDVILVDSPDPVGEALSLFTPEFYQNCKKLLKENGVFANQAGVPFIQSDEIRMINESLLKTFRHVDFFFSAIPTYAGGLMAFGFASDLPVVVSMSDLQNRSSIPSSSLSYYTPDLHLSSFNKPKYILDLLNTDKEVIK